MARNFARGDSMTDTKYQLTAMRSVLMQEEQVLEVISDDADREEIRKRVERLKSDIAKLEMWNEQQSRIRAGGDNEHR